MVPFCKMRGTKREGNEFEGHGNMKCSVKLEGIGKKNLYMKWNESVFKE